MAIGPLLGAIAVLAGGGLVYLTSANCQLLRRHRMPGLLMWFGLATIALGQALLLTWAGPATAVFIAVTLLMLVWTCLPLAAAWAAVRRDRAA